MPVTNVIILHGWWHADVAAIPEFLPDNPRNWMGWAKQELGARIHEVENQGHFTNAERVSPEFSELVVEIVRQGL